MRVTRLYFTCQTLDSQHVALSELNQRTKGRAAMAGIQQQFARLRFWTRPSPWPSSARIIHPGNGPTFRKAKQQSKDPSRSGLKSCSPVVLMATHRTKREREKRGNELKRLSMYAAANPSSVKTCYTHMDTAARSPVATQMRRSRRRISEPFQEKTQITSG